MSKLEKVQSLPSGGNAQAMLGSVVEVLYEVHKTNEILAPLNALPKQLEVLLKQDQALHKGARTIQESMTTCLHALNAERGELSKQRQALGIRDAELATFLRIQQRKLDEHSALPDWPSLLRVAMAAVVAAMVALNASPAVQWLWNSDERAKDAETAEALRIIQNNATEAERKELVRIYERAR